MFLREYTLNGGRTLIPLGHFIPDPALDADARLESDLDKLPQGLRSRVIIPSADDELRRVIERRGFFTIEAVQEANLMERQFPDGVLSTAALHFKYGELDFECNALDMEP